MTHNFILKRGNLGQQKLRQKKERYTWSNSMTYMPIDFRSNSVWPPKEEGSELWCAIPVLPVRRGGEIRMLLKDAQSLRRCRSNLLLLPAGGAVGAEFRRRKGNIPRMPCVCPGRRPPWGGANPPRPRPQSLTCAGRGSGRQLRLGFRKRQQVLYGSRDSGRNHPGVWDHADAAGAASGVSGDI